MKHWSLILLFCIVISGCVSSQIIPEEKLLSSLRTIDVVPIETSPLIFTAVSENDRANIDAILKSSTASMGATISSKGSTDASLAKSAASIMFVPIPYVFTGASILAVIGGTAMLSEAATTGNELPNELAIFESGQPTEVWTPSVEFAKTAAARLNNTESRDVRMPDGYVKLPISNRSTSWHMENWLGPIRRFYNADKSIVSYPVADALHADAILEVGVINYEYYSGTLVLQVFAKLIDPRTNQVIGRVRNYSSTDSGPILPLLQNDAEKLKDLIVDTGNLLLSKCLAELGLLRK